MTWRDVLRIVLVTPAILTAMFGGLAFGLLWLLGYRYPPGLMGLALLVFFAFWVTAGLVRVMRLRIDVQAGTEKRRDPPDH